MKSAGSLYVVSFAVVVIAAVCLLLGCVLNLAGSVAITRWRFATAVASTVAAMGVICLAWHWQRLAKSITSMADLLSRQNGTSLAAGRPKIAEQRYKNRQISRLSEAIDSYLHAYRDDSACLRKQVYDLQLQFQLSQRQKKNTEAIIYSIRDAVIVVDEFDRLLMANEAAGRLFGFDFRNIRLQPVSGLVGRDKSELVAFLQQCRNAKIRHTRREMQFRDKTGQRTFDCIISCVYDHAERDAVLHKDVKCQPEQVCGVVAVLHDITREKEISQMKNDFVNHVSHELKTPLASITAYSEMLYEDEIDDEDMRKQFYDVIQSQARRLNRLIENILNISRIESGLMEVRKEPLSLTVLIKQQLQMIRGSAEEKNILLKTSAEKLVVCDQVYADKDMVSQVIVNLLSNAVKYTPPGGSVSVKAETDDITNVARVSITDTGVGIPPDEIEHVFDKFYRVGANKDQAKGTGLGLNLVKQIVEKVHNGRVFVKSQPQKGSTFGFELPLATPAKIEV